MDGGGSARRLSPASGVLSTRAAYDLRQPAPKRKGIQAVLTGVLVRPELQCRMGGGDDRRQRKIGFAEEVGAAVLLASGSHEWAHGVPANTCRGSEGL